MSMFEWLFRRKVQTAKPPTPDESRPTASVGTQTATTERFGDDRRPFDIIADALHAWDVGDAANAEDLFVRGLKAYQRLEPAGVDFALGRYGAFLIDQNRIQDAAVVLEQAIERSTDIPAVWSDYLGLVSERRDLDCFKRTIERMAVAVKHRVETEFVLAHARRADRQGAAEFAEAVARWAVERAGRDGDKDGRWAAIGDLGRILERAGRLDDAVTLWRDAFKEGSRDPETANRLSMHLERAKDYEQSAAVIRAALRRGLPANVEESLRKRLARCEVKAEPRASRPKQKRPDVTAYSVRRESSLVEPLFQIRTKPAVKDLDVLGSVARCLLTSKDAATLVDIDLSTGSELRRIDSLPVLTDAWFAPDGRGLGVRRTAAIGKGPTLLRFIGSEGRVMAEASVPDATSEIALGPDLWYVGCRDGYLYAFGLDGKQRWKWETPGSKDFEHGATFRPCPYYVASQGSFAAIASMGNVYAVSADGRTLWHAAIPNERQTRWEFTLPLPEDQDTDEPFRVLGLPPDAPREAVKSAYRRLALATHPDRNAGDQDAASAFRVIQTAYERILAGAGSAAEARSGSSVSIEINGLGPTASFLTATEAGVVVGSSQGRLYAFGKNGRLQQARVLGDGPVRAALKPDGTLGAAWCSDSLLFFNKDTVVNAAEALDWPRALTMLGDDVVLWRGNDVQVLDGYGRLIWSAEFSKTITAIATQGDVLVCAAGVLTAFRRRGGA